MSEQTTNLSIWNEVSETNPDHTKLVTIGQRSYTAIAPTSQAKKATEIFGAYGLGWGLSKSDLDWTLKDDGLVIHNAEFFYTIEGKREAFLIKNSAQYKTPDKYNEGKFRIDDDFAKKLETNTLSKSLSKLGFNADVFMGQFDDMEYVNEQRLKAGLEAIDSPEGDVKDKAVNDFYEWCKGQMDNYTTLKNEASLKAVYNDNMKKAKEKCNILRLDWESIGSKFQTAQRKQMSQIQEDIKNYQKNQNQKSEK